MSVGTSADDVAYGRQVPHARLQQAAQDGDVGSLRAVYRVLDRVQYDTCVAQAALGRCQYGFWHEFVHLSKRTLTRDDFPWDARTQVVTDLIVGHRGPDRDLCDLFRAVYDTLLLYRPLGSGDGPDLEADLYAALALRPPRPTIIKLMAERNGFRFQDAHLALAQITFDRALVQYVRSRLHADAAAGASAPDPEPNDADLLGLVMDAARGQHEGDDGGAAVAQFLVDYPAMIDKLFFLVEFVSDLGQHDRADADSDCPESQSDDVDDGDVFPGPFYRPDLVQN